MKQLLLLREKKEELYLTLGSTVDNIDFMQTYCMHDFFSCLKLPGRCIYKLRLH